MAYRPFVAVEFLSDEQAARYGVMLPTRNDAAMKQPWLARQMEGA
jgi:hypothetical protein